MLDRSAAAPKISQRTLDFVSKLPSVEGWLYDDCVFVTAAIMHAMAKHGIKGPNFEIGVYKGKYLSAMHHCAEEYYGERQKSYGMDVFWFSQEHEPQDTFKRLFGSASDFKIKVANSTEARPEHIEELCGGKPAFISIDGDHTVYPVLNDHVLCGNALLRGGVISSDDFCNWAMIGLMDGISRFFLTHNRHRIVPFVFCQNKLFSCHHEYHERYQQGIIDFCEANPELPPAKRFLALRETGLWNAKQELYGETCLLL